MASSGVSISVGGYGAAFLTAEQQERYASVKTKLCGHKAVDVADLQKNGMGSIVAAMGRLKWSKIATLSEVSYPDLVKAFYVCLKTEEDRTLTSMFKGTQIRVTRDLLASLFGVTTSRHSGVHIVDIQAKESTAAPSVEAEATVAAAESSSRIEDIPPEDIEPIGHSSEDTLPSSRVGSVLRDVLESLQSSLRDPVDSEVQIAEVVASGHIDEIVMEESPSQGEQVVAREDLVVEYALIEGEQHVDEQAASQGEQNANAPIDDLFSEDIVESASEEENESEEPVVRAREDKRKSVAKEVPLLTSKSHRRSGKKKLKVNLKPIVERLDEQGKILCSVRSDMDSFFITQSSSARELGALSSELASLRKDYDSMRKVLICTWT
ncbi:hypothetical protein Taro_056137 [Colocasia esculenta]|uniref:Uncharacterized protein n=1 Tax=Colocasia esculenta TaxID=4460 RepID=A0A843XUX3_COLES|nr:hypothetical protein [Colocasia esculenta]